MANIQVSIPAFDYITNITCQGGQLKFYSTSQFVINGVTYCGVVKAAQVGNAFNVTQRVSGSNVITHNIGLNETQYVTPVAYSASLPADVKALISGAATFLSTTRNLTTVYLVTDNSTTPTESTVDLSITQQSIYISPGSTFYTNVGSVILLSSGSTFGFDAPTSSNSGISSTSVTLDGDVTGTGTGIITTTLANVLVGSGTFGDATNSAQVTVNSKGLITNITNVPISASSGITALTGDGTATGPGSAALTLATVNSNVGTFGDATHVAQVTTNAKGLITAVTSVPISASAGITDLTGDVTATGPGSSAATLATVNADVGTFGDAGNAVTITVNEKGLITAIAETAITENGITAMTGDVTATGPGAVTSTLATVNSNVGTFGDSTHVAQVTINAKGLITAASAVAISGGAGSNPRSISIPPTAFNYFNCYPTGQQIWFGSSLPNSIINFITAQADYGTITFQATAGTYLFTIPFVVGNDSGIMKFSFNGGADIVLDTYSININNTASYQIDVTLIEGDNTLHLYCDSNNPSSGGYVIAFANFLSLLYKGP